MLMAAPSMISNACAKSAGRGGAVKDGRGLVRLALAWDTLVSIVRAWEVIDVVVVGDVDVRTAPAN